MLFFSEYLILFMFYSSCFCILFYFY